MLMLLHGPDTYRSRERLHALEAGFRKKYDTGGFNLVRLDGEKLTVADLRREVTTVGFLSTKRMLIVERLLGAARDVALQEAVQEICARHAPTPDIVLLFWEEELEDVAKGKAGAPLLAHLLRNAKIEAFPLLEGAKLQTWVTNAVRDRSGRISRAAATLLVSLVGSDLWQMAHEVAKLTSYAGSREISNADVRLLVRGTYEADIFRLVDAISERKAATALALLDAHLASGEPPLALLAMLLRQVRILLHVHALGVGTPPAQIARALRLHPFVARKAAAAAPRFTPDELRDLFGQLVALDAKLKTSALDPRLLFARLVVGIARV